MQLPQEQSSSGADTSAAQFERRLAVVRRLIERGVPVRTLEALLPGWEDAIASALDEA